MRIPLRFISTGDETKEGHGYAGAHRLSDLSSSMENPLIFFLPIQTLVQYK